MATLNILEKAEKYVRQLYADKVSPKYHYHSIYHTVDVVNSSRLIGHASQLTETDMELLLLAAWFHDSGYAVQYEYNEAIGANIAREFLENEAYHGSIETIERIILATDLRRNTIGQLQEIIRDADLAHLGRYDFTERNELLRQEWNEVLDKNFSEADWNDMTLGFLQLHTFKSQYALTNLEPVKLYHLANLLNAR